MSDGVPYGAWTNAVALESSPVSWGGGALSNFYGSSANAIGGDSISSIATAQNTAPETPKNPSIADTNFLDNISGILPNAKSAMVEQAVNKIPLSKTVLYSVLLVVIALLIFSRGLGMIGEEGAGVIVDLGDPAKYPGIGHAVKSIRGRK